MNNTITLKGIIWGDDYLDRDLPSAVNVNLTYDQIDAYVSCGVYSGPWSLVVAKIRERISEIYQCNIRAIYEIDWADPSMLGIPTFEA